MTSAGVLLMGLIVLMGICCPSEAEIPKSTLQKIKWVNRQGDQLGVVIPNAYEMSPLLQSSSFFPDKILPYLDFSGRRFRFGKVGKQNVIIVMTGLSMLNAGIATELLLSLFNVKGVLHFGIAGNANPNLEVGDVTVPLYWAHSGLWNWQRYGAGPETELSLESSGDFTRKIGFLRFSDYSNVTRSENFLNNIWYQPEEIFPVTGTPEIREHAFWVEVDQDYYSSAKKLVGLKLERCINATACLPRDPVVALVDRGISANTFLDNAAYRQFLFSKFNVTAIDMETAAVALVCLQLKIPFIAIRSLSDLAGGGSDLSNEANLFSSLAAQNAWIAALKFISLISPKGSLLSYEDV